MKIGRFRAPGAAQGDARLGVVLPDGPSLKVLDVAAAASAGGHVVPPTMEALIDAGLGGLGPVYEAIAWAEQRGEPGWYAAEPEVDWLLPLRPGNCIAGGRNFGGHREESLAYWAKQGKTDYHVDFPMGFLKTASAMVPTRTTVQRPEDVADLDYEIEAVAVIGSSVRNVPEERALEAVFGYTILNDMSARTIQRQEMRNQSILLGKNFPGLGPLGPYLVTADEVPDPAVLDLQLTVNGEVRQQASCTDLIFTFPAMIAHWSRMGLNPGDLITTGTPDGVASGRQPDPAPFYLKSGDRVLATVDQIGTLETLIQ